MNADVRAVNWQNVIAGLGLTPDRDSLPARFECPLCHKGPLHVYHDPLLGAWGYCGKCFFADDMIALAKQTWKLDTAATVNRLILKGVGELTEAFAKSYDDAKAKPADFERFWQSAEPLPYRATEYLPGGAPRALPDHWRNMLRLANRNQLLSTFYGAAPLVRSCIPKNWPEFALMPLDTFPGLRHGAFAIRHDQTRVICTDFSQDTLVLGLEVAHSTPSEFVIVCDNLRTTLELQIAGLRENGQLLPLCGFHNRGGLGLAWRQMRRRLVFWGEAPTIAAFREAASCEGWCIFRPLPKGPISSLGQLRTLNTAARPWQFPLVEYLKTLADEEVRNFILALNLSPAALGELKKIASKELLALLEPALDTRADVIQYAGYEVSRDGPNLIAFKLASAGSHRPLSEKRICFSDTTMLIKKIIMGTNKRYIGEVLYKNKHFNFDVPAADLETDAEKWLCEQLYSRGWGVPYVHPKWREYMLRLAIFIGKPEIVTPAEKLGWIREDDLLATSHWSLNRSGEVKEWSEPLTTPPGRLHTPVPMTAMAVQALSDISGACTFWVVLAQVVASVLSPITNRVPRNLMLLGDSARAIGPLAAKLAGCSIMGTASLRASDNMMRQLQASAQAKWPVMLFTDANFNQLPTLLTNESPVSIYRPSTDLRGLELMIANDCDLVDIHESDHSTAMLERFGADVLPAYLLDLARRDFKLMPGPHVIAGVLSDMSRWWKQLGGVAHMQHRFFYGPRLARHTLYRLLMLCREKIQCIPLGFSEYVADNKVPVETDNARVYFEAARFARVISRYAHFDMIRLGQYLHGAGLLLTQPEAEIWAVPIEVWDSVIQASRRRVRLPGVQDEWPESVEAQGWVT